jgi:predicted small lipoprotein YifL
LPKISLIVCILILLPGCGAKGELFLAKPTSEKAADTVNTDSETDPQVVEPKAESDQMKPSSAKLKLELPSK